MPTPPSPSTVLYTARPAWWVRLALLVVGLSVAAMVGGSALALLLTVDGPSSLGWIALALAVPCALLVLALVALGQRPRFTVSTAGVEIRTPLRTRRIGWGEIAVIEVDHGWVHQGQTLAVLRDGRRIGAPITEARSAMRRGEHATDHGPGFREAAIPTRAAIDAHRRWLRGEFSDR